MNSPTQGFDLSRVPWHPVAPGLREKAHLADGRRFRLVEFSDTFQDPDWCLRGHAGYVLEGEIIVDVDGTLIPYRKGHVIDLAEGVRHRHHATPETATLFLVEDMGWTQPDETTFRSRLPHRD